ncbi:uncharacterized protein N7483_002009 [Penicillium malachiteum]|uniref:uncharacterized protein n=1 Tax=Penicillium malachiteum TaxID=1324776 RepID=UPI00254825F9|nr:uncharacterized protein N7483_002009 [Penicillium malachiteum]KAJ5736884.1 hypothetical protein N7483_002009 [Penicillium malachiteum]
MANKGREQALRHLNKQIPVFNKNTFLFIFLTDFTNEEENALMEAFRLLFMINGREIQAWKPSRHLLSSLGVQGTHRDSQANIYAIAMLAYRSGLQFSGVSNDIETKPATIFIVVDELSKRCWTNTHKVGEQGTISILMVHVQSETDDYTPPYCFTIPVGVRVEVARYDLSLWHDFESGHDFSNDSTLSENGLLDILGYFQNGEHRDYSNEEEYLDDFWSGGIGSWGYKHWSTFIYDPDQRPFQVVSSSETSSTINETWRALLPRLPAELVGNIISFTAAEPLTEKILWEKRQSDEHLHLFLTFPTTENELHETSLIIHDLLRQQPEDSPKTAELIPLHCHQMISRRDIWTFWEAYRQHEPDERLHSPFMNLLLHSFTDNLKDHKMSPFAVVRDLRHMPLAIMHITFTEMCLPQQKRKQGLDWSWKAYPVNTAELLHHPDQPCYEVSPLWRGARSFDILDNRRDRWISVFYLTKRFTEKEDSKLRQLVEEDLKSVCYIPWEHEEDGGLDDMWKILLKVYRYHGLGTKCHRLFFIDRESFNDRRLIIIEAYFYLAGRQVQSRSKLLQGLEAPLLAGFRHCRIPATEAPMISLALSKKTMVFEELEGPDDEDTEFIRPGWPSFSDLPPTNPFRPDWEEPTTIPVWEIFNVMGGGLNPNPETETNS